MAQSIIVTEEMMQPRMLLASVSAFARFASEKALYTPHEISPNALRAARIAYYVEQVRNGGHRQYGHNGGMDPNALRICQEGLDIIGHPVSQFHRRSVALATSEPRLVEMKFEGRSLSPNDARLKALDSDFYAATGDDSFDRASERWLRSLPEQRVVPGSEIGASLAAYAGANPKLWERKAERDVARAQAFEADPLRQALVYLCEQARPPRRFMGVGAGQFAKSPDGWMLTWFRVQTDQGPVWASFHPNVSVLVSGPLNDGTVVSRVPTTELFQHVQRKTGQDLSKEAPFQKTGAPASRPH